LRIYLFFVNPSEEPTGEAKRQPGEGPKSGLFFGVLGLGLLSCILIIGLIVLQSFRDREELVKREKDELARMAESVATDTVNMFGRIRFFLETADYWLSQNPEADPRFDPAFIKLVDAFRESMRDRVDIRLVSRNGGLFHIPSEARNALADVSDRDYYKAQLLASTRGFHISDPVLSRITNRWGIPISYPLSSRNGGMSVIFAVIDMPILDEPYEKIRPKPNGSIILIRDDGLILERTPFVQNVLGTRIASDMAAWWSHLRETPDGIWTLHALTDNEDRIVASKIIDDPRLVVSVSARLGDVLAPWFAILWRRILIAVLMVAAISAISSKLFFALHSLELAQTELRSNMERLARSDAMKDKLFSVIAHDLRGPIGGMASLLDTISTDREGMSPEELGELLEALRAASQNTTQLLENLLDWSLSQRGELPFSPAHVLVYPIAEECAGVFGLSASGKGITVELAIENGLEARADSELLKIIFRNLLSNAVKFSVRGDRVLVSASKAEGGARIEVRDEGLGMERSQIEALYGSGAVSSRRGTANERGSGLGFVLCKEMVELHGGRIEVESETGKGSAISVFLPD
jgi:signal transduction histidine kinase